MRKRLPVVVVVAKVKGVEEIKNDIIAMHKF
jgi:hypothetical protein